MAIDLPRNTFKRRLAEGRPQIGLWLSLTSPVATEVAAGAGFDWLLIDMEHAANDLATVAQHLRAAEGGTAEPVVRPPVNEPVIVKRLLDLGVRTLLLPMVQSVDEARAAVAATRYPPEGIRGVSLTTRANRYGRVSEYHARASEELCVLVQVETRHAIGIADQIAAVDGVDGVFIGPADLSADFGKPGKWTEPDVWDAIVATGDRIKGAGKAAGFLSGAQDRNMELLKRGFGFVAVGSDLALLVERTNALVATYDPVRQSRG